MPELPEVQTIVDGIEPYLLNNKSTKCNLYVRKLRWELQNDMQDIITGSIIYSVSRRAKYIIISTDKLYLTIHLGMTGTLELPKKNDIRKKHDHFEIYLSSNLILGLMILGNLE